MIPIEVSVTPAAKTADRVEHSVLFVEAAKKRDMLVELFDDATMSRVLVFTRTKHGADRVARTLDEAGVDAAAIHGNKSQGQRERALGRLPRRQRRACWSRPTSPRAASTSTASAMSSISNCREVAEAYVHRIGRTARAGNGGQAISLCDHEERDLLRAIERLTRLTLPRPTAAAPRVRSPRPSCARRQRASGGAGAEAPASRAASRRSRGGRPVAVETRPVHRPRLSLGRRAPGA